MIGMSLCFHSSYNVCLQTKPRGVLASALVLGSLRYTAEKIGADSNALQLHLLLLYIGEASKLCFHFNSCLKCNSFLLKSIRKGSVKRCLDLSGWLLKRDFEAQSILVRFLYKVSVYWTFFFLKKHNRIL